MTIQKVIIGKCEHVPALNGVTFVPKGAHVYLIGENGVGKSTIIQLLNIATGNQKDIPPNWNDEVEVEYKNKAGETFWFTAKSVKGKPVITVRSANGMKDTSKGVLYSIVGKPLDYEIEEFVGWAETTPGRRKMLDEYKKLLPAEDIMIIENAKAKIKLTYDARTELNRKIEMMKGFIRESDDTDYNIHPVDVSGLEASIAAATKKNELIASGKSRLENYQKENATYQAEKDKLLQQMADLDTKMSDNGNKIREGNEWLKKNTEIDTAEMVSQMATAGAHNAKYAEVQDLKKKQQDLKILQDESGELTVLYESTSAAIEDAIKELVGPIPDLSFNDDGLIYKGVPVTAQTLSTSEIMELGWLMRKALNPESDVVFVENSNLIGQKRWDEMRKWADDNGLQIIYEVVERGQTELKIEIEGA